MGDLLTKYEQGFAKMQPEVRFEEQLTSTVTAVAGVATGHADIGLLGREIWPTEVQAFARTRGHLPIVIEVATGSYDVPKATFALMVFVPAANPIASLSADELDRIFATADRPISTWGELGLKGEWATRPIHLYGFSVDNDKSQIFRQLIFRKGEGWSPRLKEFSNAAGAGGADAGELITDAVSQDAGGIGISNVHYANPKVRALALATPTHKAPIAPTRKNVADRSYPLTRGVYMVLGNDPSRPASAAVIEFLRFVLSRGGYEAVIEEGNYLPLTPEIAASQLRRLPADSR